MSILYFKSMYILEFSVPCRFPVGSGGKESAFNAGDPVWSLGQKDPPEKGVITHSSVLAWRYYGQRSLPGYSPWGPQNLDVTEQLTLSVSLFMNCILGLSDTTSNFWLRETEKQGKNFLKSFPAHFIGRRSAKHLHGWNIKKVNEEMMQLCL